MAAREGAIMPKEPWPAGGAGAVISTAVAAGVPGLSAATARAGTGSGAAIAMN
jgi:hypothetical protein